MNKQLITLRATSEQRADIDARAKAAGESRTAYMLRRSTEDDTGLAQAIRATLKNHT